MVEAEGHLKLLPPSKLHIYKLFEHIDMLSIGIQYLPYTVISILLGSDFGVLCHLWSQHDVIMSWFRLAATSNCFPHPNYTYKVLEHIDMLSIGIQQQPYTVKPTLLG